MNNLLWARNLDALILNYEGKYIDLNHIKQQASNTNKPVFVLHNGNSYNIKIPNVTFLPYYSWHNTLLAKKVNKQITYKASVSSNRTVNQASVYSFTALARYLDSDCILKLASEVEVNEQTMFTGNNTLDDLYDIFKETWQGKSINPTVSVFEKSALHFTNEIYEYSFMMDGIVPYTHPGPLLTQNTLNCLCTATGFIPVGQFETYKTLASLGFNFDYNLDLNFDNDPGNLTRFENIVKLIQQLANMDAQEIFFATQESSEYNQQQIASGAIQKKCEEINSETVEQIHTALR